MYNKQNKQIKNTNIINTNKNTHGFLGNVILCNPRFGALPAVLLSIFGTIAKTPQTIHKCMVRKNQKHVTFNTYHVVKIPYSSQNPLEHHLVYSDIG